MKKVFFIALIVLFLSSDSHKKVTDKPINYEQFSHIYYQDILTQPSNNYDVFIYYPGCQYCYGLLPLIKNKINNEQHYLIFFFKIDTTVTLSRTPNHLPISDIKQFHINGFPLLLDIEKGLIVNYFLGRLSIANELENNQRNSSLSLETGS